MTLIPVGRFVAYQEPMITSGKPINVPTVIGSLRKIMPRATATAGFIYVINVIRTAPIRSSRVKKTTKASAVQMVASTKTLTMDFAEGV